MSNEPKRYVVSDLGFGFAVYDTQAPQPYTFEAGKDAEQRSSNRLNSQRVDIFATIEEAVRCAQELERAQQRAG